MLRIRSRTKTSKQTIVGDHTNHPRWFPLEKLSFKNYYYYSSSSSYSFISRTFLNNTRFINKPDSMLFSSPISVLDKNTINNVVGSSRFRVLNKNNAPEKTHVCQHVWEQKTYSKKGIGLALFIDENNYENKQQNRKRVVHAFGSKLRVEVNHHFSLFSSPESPVEFGIKTPRNKIQKTRVNFEELEGKNEISYGFNGGLMSEIDEESEDYTCVISHGPNPKTTHIFGNCIVESCCGKIDDLPSFLPKKSKKFLSYGEVIPSKNGFLSFCHHCKKQLGEGRDIFMYRGEKAFCSEECRCQGVFFDEVENKKEFIL
ncbi:hypothetical protein vseg_013980 [Gypsophila vaccaria]